MLRISLLCVLVLTAISSSGQQLYKYTVSKVTEGVTLLEPILSDTNWVSSNIILIVNERDALVVDSGQLPSAGEEAIKEIKKITDKPVKYVVNTHWHGDHWQGNEAFLKTYPGVEFISTTKGLEGITTRGIRAIKYYWSGYFTGVRNRLDEILKTGADKSGKKYSVEELKRVQDQINVVNKEINEYNNLKPTLPTITFSDRLILKMGSREIQLLYLGYGNTTGDAVVYLPKEKVLITGDLVVYPSPYESASFSKEWTDILKKLRTFSFDYLLPGHGGIEKDSSYLDFLIALFDEIIKQVNTQVNYGEKITLEDVLAQVTHENVVKNLASNPKWQLYIKNLDKEFVVEAVKRAHSKAREGKL